jgi:Leucine-rich repeat (LRR) protein
MASETAKVVQKCDEAKETRTLDLSTCDLRKFPDAVYFLMKDTPLETLSLSHNQLKVIPRKFPTKFTTLTKLDISNNQLATLPLEISCLTLLTSLNASYNSLQQLPQSMEDMVNLVHMDVSHNQISLPFKTPSSLQYLIASNNLLPELPNISISVDLKEVDVSHNRITAVSIDEVTLLPWLQTIDMRNNLLDEGMCSALKCVIRVNFLIDN